MKDTTTSVRLPRAVADLLEFIKAKDGINKGKIINQGIMRELHARFESRAMEFIQKHPEHEDVLLDAFESAPKIQPNEQ